MKSNILENIFNYRQDRSLLIKLARSTKHVAFKKQIIMFLSDHNDKEVPELVFEFTSKKYTKGYRASVLLLLEKYDCCCYFDHLLKLFLKDSFNCTWYCYDILKKYLIRLKVEDLKRISDQIASHLKREKEKDKIQYHELLLKQILSELKKRPISNSAPSSKRKKSVTTAMIKNESIKTKNWI